MNVLVIVLSFGRSLGRISWQSDGPERSQVLLFWKLTKRFELLEFENLLNEKQTIMVRKLDYLCPTAFTENKYGRIVSLDLIKGSNTQSKFIIIRL